MKYSQRKNHYLKRRIPFLEPYPLPVLSEVICSQGYEFIKGMMTNPSKTLPHSDFRRALGHLEYHTRQRVREQFRLVGAYWYFKGWLWISPPSSGDGTDGGAGDHDQNDDITPGCLYASGHPQNDPADSLTPGCAKSIGTGNQ